MDMDKFQFEIPASESATDAEQDAQKAGEEQKAEEEDPNAAILRALEQQKK
jgi:hypothetical protein